MNESPKRVSAFRRCTVLALGSLFLLFQSLSQPHRVHHFLRAMVTHTMKLRLIQTITSQDRDQTKPAQANCVLQSVAQNCQLGQVELVELRFVESLLEAFQPKATPWVDSFTSFPFFQRAPPKDTLSS